MERLVRYCIEEYFEHCLDSKYEWLAYDPTISKVEIEDYIFDNFEDELNQIGVDGESDEMVYRFCDVISRVMDSVWFYDVKESYVTAAQTSIDDIHDWERTKASLMPKYRP